MVLVLGLDLGTSSLKGILFDLQSAKIIAMSQAEYPLHKPSSLEAVQNPEDWWQATISVVQALKQELAFSPEIAAISFSGQMHGSVLMNKADKPVMPAIIWADQRSATEAVELPQRIGKDNYLNIAGTLPATGFMASSLLWLQKNQPQALEQTKFVLLPKDYLRFRMTGDYASEYSDAASTGILDIRQKSWSKTIVEAIGIDEEILPELFPSHALVGQLHRQAAEELGLKAGIAVIAGAADQAAQALGNALIQEGAASVTIGSGGQVFVPSRLESFKVDERLHLFNHAVPDTYYVLAAILSAGLSLRWLRGITGLAGNPHAYEILSAEAAEVPAGANGLLFLPYLSGERTPHMDALARGSFVGLSHYHQRGHLARAVMEGVCFALRQAMELSFELASRPNRLIIAGGASKSMLWRKLQASIYGLAVQKSTLDEHAGIGASLLAGIGIGFYGSFKEAVEAVNQFDEATRGENELIYDELFEEFKALYPRLKSSFHHLGAIDSGFFDA